MGNTETRMRLMRRLSSMYGKILTSLAGIWLVLEVINYFVQSDWLSQYRAFGLIVFLLVGLVIGSVREVLFTHHERDLALEDKEKAEAKNYETSQRLTVSKNQDIATHMLEALRTAYSEKKWEEVIKIGSPLSRPLWTTGRYQLRIEIGKLVESAAAFSNKYEIQAAALIDDMGWTNVPLGRTDEALNHIQHGLTIAQKAGSNLLISKAYRHLAGIALKQGRFPDAEQYIEKSEEAIQAISDPKVKNELEAGLNYQRGRLLQSKNNLDEALKVLQIAEESFINLGDRDRAVKCLSAIGQIYFKMGKTTLAKDTFRQALTKARQESRRDCELKNLIGLANLALTEESYVDAKGFYLDAAQVALELGDASKAEELKLKAKNLSC